MYVYVYLHTQDSTIIAPQPAHFANTKLALQLIYPHAFFDAFCDAKLMSLTA